MVPIVYPIRINKYLRDKGFGSRRETDSLISEGKVLINGKPASLGAMINENDKVEIAAPAKAANRIYLAYYKPRGLATQSMGGKTDVVKEWSPRGIFPVGRLDKESEGLLILTNDGRLTTRVLGGDSKHEKEYVVNVREKLRQGVALIFEKGMETKPLGTLLPARTKIINPHTIRIVLREGKRHQIRVMLNELGYTVTSLKRIRVGHVSLGKLKEGQTRNLTKEEVEKFFA